MDSVEETLRKAREVQQRFKKFMERKVEQDQSIEETLKRIDKTQATLQQTRQTISSIDQIYSRLQKVLADSIDSAVKSIEKHQSFNIADHNFEATRPDSKKVADLLKDSKRILVLTGAGISAASGIPTFRGEKGFWTKSQEKKNQSEEQISPESLLTYRCFQQYPKKTWEWLRKFYQLKLKAKPNRGHIALDQILQDLSRRGKQVMLVTQNIDNFHKQVHEASKKAKNFKPYPIHQIHGNILKVRCDNCSLKQGNLVLYSYQNYIQPIKEGKQIKCPRCEQVIRPNIMFFDEAYNETINRCDTIRTFLKNVDALLVIGTALQTGLAYQIVQTAYQNKIQIIEANLACQIRRDKVWWMQEKAEVSLEQLRIALTKK